MHGIDPHEVKQQIQQLIRGLVERKASSLDWDHDHEWFYVKRSSHSRVLYQGDLITWTGLSYTTADEEDEILDDSTSKCTYALLLSNTCDMQMDSTPNGLIPRENTVLAMPLMELTPPQIFFEDLRQRGESLPKSMQSKLENFWKDARTYASTSGFFLPSIPGVRSASYPESPGYLIKSLPALYGEFGQMQPISSRMLNRRFSENTEIRVTSMTQKAYYILLLKLSAYFLRPDARTWQDS